MGFTEEELLELRKADREIDRAYIPTVEDRYWSNALDREAKEVEQPGKYTPKVAAYQKAYREANPELIKARKAAWYQKNKERIDAEKRDYQKLNRRYFQDLQNEKRRQNREEANRKQREYRQRKKEEAPNE